MPSPEVRMEQLASTPLAVVRRQAKGPEIGKAVQESCGIVWNFIRSRGLTGGRNVALYLDGKVSIEAGAELEAAFESDGTVVRSQTPAGSVATATHFGPYGQMGQAHEAIHAWCRQQGHRQAGPSWEVYGHWDRSWNDNPALIRTDIFYLLKS
jgi:effector-binding domain-containing protein